MSSVKSILAPLIVLIALCSSSAQAVHINPRGLGEVLLFPYYTTTGGYDTYINLVNTRDESKALKLRFRESMNGASVLDVNIYLSPNDHWSGVIYLNRDGPGVVLQSADRSCTLPLAISQRETIPFQNQNFQDDSIAGLERTREGFVEVFEMAVVGSGTMDWPAKLLQGVDGVPADCASVAAAWAPGGTWSLNPLDGMSRASGGIYGYATLIDVEEGTEASYDATAIDNFTPPAGSPLHTSPESSLPTLGSGDTAYRLMNDGEFISSTADSGIDAISALLMQATLSNDFILEPNVAAGTDWVITFPTKNEYVNGETALAPFTSIWEPVGSSACEEFSFFYHNREGSRLAAPVVYPPWPGLPPQPEEILELCSQANVFSFAGGYPNEGILDADEGRNRTSLDLEEGYDNGWAVMGFDFDRPSLTAGSVGFRGLPFIGFSLIRFVNGTVVFGGQRVLSNYVGIAVHKGQAKIEVE